LYKQKLNRSRFEGSLRIEAIRDYPPRLKVSDLDLYGRIRDILADGVCGIFITIPILSLIRLFKPRRAKALELPFRS